MTLVTVHGKLSQSLCLSLTDFTLLRSTGSKFVKGTKALPIDKLNPVVKLPRFDVNQMKIYLYGLLTVKHLSEEWVWAHLLVKWSTLGVSCNAVDGFCQLQQIFSLLDLRQFFHVCTNLEMINLEKEAKLMSLQNETKPNHFQIPKRIFMLEVNWQDSITWKRTLLW